MGTQAEAVEAPHGSRTVVLRVRFFTNDIATEADHVLRKHIWSAGRVEMEANETHDIPSDASKNVPFQTLAEIPAAIEQILVSFGVRMHPSARMRAYAEAK